MRFEDLHSALVVTESYKTQRKKFVDAGADAEEVKRLMDIHKELKNRGVLKGEDEINIDRIKTFEDLEDLVRRASTRKSEREKKKELKIRGAEKVAENDDYVLFFVKTPEAMRKYGSGTKWCIASDQNVAMFLRSYKLGDENKAFVAISKHNSQEEDPVHYKWAIIVRPSPVSKTYYNAQDQTESESEFIKLTGLDPDIMKPAEPQYDVPLTINVSVVGRPKTIDMKPVIKAKEALNKVRSSGPAYAGAYNRWNTYRSRALSKLLTIFKDNLKMRNVKPNVRVSGPRDNTIKVFDSKRYGFQIKFDNITRDAITITPLNPQNYYYLTPDSPPITVDLVNGEITPEVIRDMVADLRTYRYVSHEP